MIILKFRQLSRIESSNYGVKVELHRGSELSPYRFVILKVVFTEKVIKDAPESIMFAANIVLCGGM